MFTGLTNGKNGTIEMVSEEHILELQKLIKETYGRDLTLEEVSQIGNTLVGYFDTLAKIYHEMQKDKEVK